MDWCWLSKTAVLAIHAAQVAEHGGAAETRDEGLLDSALAKPRNLVAYGDPSAADLAASYAFGIARNHPFVDGNKRTAFVAAATFLLLNGFEMTASEVDVAETVLRLAAGAMSEQELAAWFQAASQAMP